MQIAVVDAAQRYCVGGKMQTCLADLVNLMISCTQGFQSDSLHDSRQRTHSTQPTSVESISNNTIEAAPITGGEEPINDRVFSEARSDPMPKPPRCAAAQGRHCSNRKEQGRDCRAARNFTSTPP